MEDWIEYGGTWEAFENEKLATPGTLVEIYGDTSLIGELNEQGGVCNCCPMYSKTDIVTKYKKLNISELQDTAVSHDS